jgi:hypothetical protein
LKWLVYFFSIKLAGIYFKLIRLVPASVFYILKVEGQPPQWSGNLPGRAADYFCAAQIFGRELGVSQGESHQSHDKQKTAAVSATNVSSSACLKIKALC